MDAALLSDEGAPYHHILCTSSCITWADVRGSLPRTQVAGTSTGAAAQPAPICYRLTVAATRGSGMTDCPRCVQIADLELNAGATPIALTRAFQTTGE
jgi:hypothetical protein